MSSTTATSTHVSDAELDRIRRDLDLAALCTAMQPQISIAIAKARPSRIDVGDAEQEAVVVLLSNVSRYATLPADQFRATMTTAMRRRIERADGAGCAWARDIVGLPEEERPDPADAFAAVEIRVTLDAVWAECDRKAQALMLAWAGDDQPTNAELAERFNLGSKDSARRRVDEHLRRARRLVAA